ncbi:MAG: DUF4166 domain-containing protein [Steroidobacteraceae bacterium]
MPHTGMIPRLMGTNFASLHPHVQAVHGGNSRRWVGRATVQRGSHGLLRLAAVMAGLPASQHNVPTSVTIMANEGSETWTRHFGSAVPMRSTLRAKDGLLAEQLGAVTMQFQIAAHEGGMTWELRRITYLAIPLPRRCFNVQVRADSTGSAYRFFVAVRLMGLGELIRYEGELDVTD